MLLSHRLRCRRRRYWYSLSWHRNLDSRSRDWSNHCNWCRRSRHPRGMNALPERWALAGRRSWQQAGDRSCSDKAEACSRSAWTSCGLRVYCRSHAAGNHDGWIEPTSWLLPPFDVARTKGWDSQKDGTRRSAATLAHGEVGVGTALCSFGECKYSIAIVPIADKNTQVLYMGTLYMWQQYYTHTREPTGLARHTSAPAQTTEHTQNTREHRHTSAHQTDLTTTYTPRDRRRQSTDDTARLTPTLTVTQPPPRASASAAACQPGESGGAESVCAI